MTSTETTRLPDFSALPREVARALDYQRHSAQGVADAVRFVAEVNADRDLIADRIHVVRERINDPRHQQTLMKPGTSTRTFQEGYLQGLTDALNIIAGGGKGSELSPGRRS